MNLKDKKILITGATGGIGHSLVKKFYELGSVILATGTNVNKLDQLQNSMENSFESLERSVNKQLETTNSMLGFNNLLTAVQTYQMYKINKNTKSLRP